LKEHWQLIRTKFDDNNFRLSRDFSNLGLTWLKCGDGMKAMEYFEKALAINETLFGTDHPHLVNNFNNMGLIWNHFGNEAKTTEYLALALALLIKLYLRDHISE